MLSAAAGLVLSASLTAAAMPETDPVKLGDRLYRELKCAACHEAGPAPTLAYSGSKLQKDWVKGYLLKPHRIRWSDFDVRPVTRMPDYQLTEDEAERLSAYLDALRDPERFPERKPRADEELRADFGKQLFAQYLCINCHFVGKDGEEYGPDLTGVGRRLRPEYIETFLRNPAALIPGNPMQDLKLWPKEAEALTDYLVGLRGGSEKVARRPATAR